MLLFKRFWCRRKLSGSRPGTSPGPLPAAFDDDGGGDDDDDDRRGVDFRCVFGSERGRVLLSPYFFIFHPKGKAPLGKWNGGLVFSRPPLLQACLQSAQKKERNYYSNYYYYYNYYYHRQTKRKSLLDSWGDRPKSDRAMGMWELPAELPACAPGGDG